MATGFAPAVPAGATAVIVVALTTATLVAATPPIVTLAGDVKFVPVIVIGVPPASGPAFGETPVTDGVARYVNAFAAVAVPPAVVSVTFFAPAGRDGVTAVTVVALTTVKPVAIDAADGDALVPLRFVPVIVMVVPPPVRALRR